MTDLFSNEPIPTDQLPRLADHAFVPVDPRYLRVTLTGVALAAAVVAGGTVMITVQANRKVVPFLIGTVVLMLLALVAFIRVLEVRRLAYQLREHDLSLRSGVITHRVESLPFSRIQHVNVRRGPIERSLGLATLQVSTAGPDISIPGLTQADAERIKLLVTERADVADDTAFDDKAADGGAEVLRPTVAAAAPIADFTTPSAAPPPPPA